MKTPPWVIVVVVVIIAFLLWLYIEENGEIEPVAVDCSKQSLAEEVSQNSKARKFVVQGTCNEQETVTITNDNVTIQGQGTDVTTINGTTEPVIRVFAARGVTLAGFTVQRGEHGILVEGSRKRGAEVTITDVNAQENEKTGLCVLGPEPTPEPSKDSSESSGKTRPYQKASAASEEGDRCVADLDLEPSEEPVGQAPQYQKERSLSSTTIWNALIRDAAAQTSLICNSTQTCVAICGTRTSPSSYSGNGGSGIVAEASTVSFFNSSAPARRCTVNINSNCAHGLSAAVGSRVEATRTTLNLNDNGNRRPNCNAPNGVGLGLAAIGSSRVVLTDSRVNSNRNNLRNTTLDIYIAPEPDRSRITCINSSIDPSNNQIRPGGNTDC